MTTPMSETKIYGVVDFLFLRANALPPANQRTLQMIIVSQGPTLGLRNCCCPRFDCHLEWTHASIAAQTVWFAHSHYLLGGGWSGPTISLSVEAPDRPHLAPLPVRPGADLSGRSAWNTGRCCESKSVLYCKAASASV